MSDYRPTCEDLLQALKLGDTVINLLFDAFMAAPIDQTMREYGFALERELHRFINERENEEVEA